MRGELLMLDPVVDRGELCETLEAGLREYFERDVTIEKFARRISQYCSSYLLEELDVTLSDGTELELIFKDMSRNAMLEGAGRIKPRFVYDPAREIETYRTSLASHHLGTATCYGAVSDPAIHRYWLFLERLPPSMLWQFGEFHVWERAAHWLAWMHSTVSVESEARKTPRAAHLIDYDADYYRRWIHRAKEFVTAGDTIPGRKATAAIEWLASKYDKVIERLIALPVTLVHGEFFASNVMIDETPRGMRICPVDWEMAGIGTGLIDLAGLTSGNWSKAERDAMALAYLQALPDEFAAKHKLENFLADFECCRLHQAVQWVGWAPGWAPPPEHAQDWFSEAISSAEALGL